MRWKKLVLPLGAAALGLAAAQARPTAAVHPWLRPLLDKKMGTIPAELQGAMTGRQGSSRLNGRAALSLFVRTTASREALEKAGVQVDSWNQGLATVRVLPGDLLALASRPDVSAISLPHPVHPLLDKSTAEVGVSVLRGQSSGVFTGATGKNVIVGIVDSGVDLDHPNFQHPDGSTRIVALWDQTLPTVAGAPFGLGAECTPAQIDAHACGEHDEVAASGHGTHVTGIAAGNGAAANETGTPYADVGMAPESRIVLVKLDFSSSANVVNALGYIFQKADALGLPAVVNLSVGSHLGAHDGSDPMELAIDSLVTAKAGRAVVVAAGNERAAAIHAGVATLQGVQVAGPVLAVPGYTPQAGADNDYLTISGYYPATDSLTAALVTPSGQHYLFGLSSGCQGENDGPDGSITVCNTTTSTMAGQATADREIYVVVRDRLANFPPRAGNWQIFLTGNAVVAGRADFWAEGTMASLLPVQFTTLADPLETVAMPGTSRQAITVGAYNTRLCWTAADHADYHYGIDPLVLGEIASFSSAGPTRDGRAKPDLAAPGMGVVSVLADEVRPALLANAGLAPSVINDFYRIDTGTSQAAAHVTGAVALLFEREPALTGAQAKAKLQGAARQDPFTAAKAGPTRNDYFGAGKLDLGPWAFADSHETNDTPAQATPILSGQPMTGYLDRSGDVDFYRMSSVQLADKVEATLTGLPADYALALLGQSAPATSCNPLTVAIKASSDHPGTQAEAVSFTNPSFPSKGAGASQYIRVTSSVGAFDAAAGYQMKAVLTRPETAAAHATTATAQVLPDFVEMKIAGAISAAEADFYSFTAVPGTQLSVSLPGRTVLIRDANGAFLVSAGGALSHYPLPGPVGGNKAKYYLVIQGAAGSYTAQVTLQ